MKQPGWRVRAFIAGTVLVSWAVLLVLMWRAYHTLPTPEQLADERHVRPPLPIDFYRNVATSTAELVFLALLLWPWRARHYIVRLLIAALVLIVWFFLSVPMDLNTMEWLHRRWQALMVLLLIICAAIYPLLTRIRHGHAES
ncbi:MAG TPA: hypothetical protein VGD27_06495 [Longimicrobiales bacterium]